MDKREKSEADVLKEKAKELEEKLREEKRNYRRGLRNNWHKKGEARKPLTLEGLSEKTGVSLSTLKRFEQGENINSENASKLAVFYGVDVDSFQIIEATKAKLRNRELTSIGAQKLIAILECIVAVLFLTSQLTRRYVLDERYRYIFIGVSLLGYWIVLSSLCCIRKVVVEKNDRKDLAEFWGMPIETFILEIIGIVELYPLLF